MNYEALHHLAHLLMPGVLAVIPLPIMLILKGIFRKNNSRLYRLSFGLMLVLLGVSGLGIFGVFLDAFAGAALMKQSIECRDHLKKLGTALLLYQQDWDECLPPANQWSNAAALHITPAEQETVYHCPAAHTPISYGFNTALNRLSTEKVPSPGETVLLFEMDTNTKNATGTKQQMAPKRHSGTTNIVFADGHAKQANEYVQLKLRWTP